MRPHHLKGLYEVVGLSANTCNQMICTLSPGVCDDTSDYDTRFKADDEGDASPTCNVTITFKTGSSTLRSWNPYKCAISAALSNGLLHFPIRSGTHLFVLNGLLSSLSHFADIVGSAGRVICIMDERFKMRPSQESLMNFMMKYTNSLIVTASENLVSLEYYQRLLGVPTSSKYAFAMSSHQRLGANSFARLLFQSTNLLPLVQRIFSFLECSDGANVSCFVACNWPLGTHVDTVRDVVCAHTHMFQKWKNAKNPGLGSQDSTKPGHQWILLDLPRYDISTRRQAQSEEEQAENVLNELKKFPNDRRTGLTVKEQIFLCPYHRNRTLLVLKAAHSMLGNQQHGERLPGMPPGLSNIPPPPDVSSIPTPSFRAKMTATPPAPDTSLRPPQILNNRRQPQVNMKGVSTSVAVANVPRYRPHVDWEIPPYHHTNAGTSRHPFETEKLHGGKLSANARQWQPPMAVPGMSGRAQSGGFGWDMPEPMLGNARVRYQKFMRPLHQLSWQ